MLAKSLLGRLWSVPSAFKGVFNFSSLSVGAEPELDKLYRKILLEVRGHDRAVLDSYEWFTKSAATELDVNITRIWEPEKNHERRTLLKSVFVHKKHRVQYEFRTYFRIFEIKHLTGSTADTFLEYIQRNLPEGVAMKVTRHLIQKMPEAVYGNIGPHPENKEENEKKLE